MLCHPSGLWPPICALAYKVAQTIRGCYHFRGYLLFLRSSHVAGSKDWNECRSSYRRCQWRNDVSGFHPVSIVGSIPRCVGSKKSVKKRISIEQGKLRGSQSAVFTGTSFTGMTVCAFAPLCLLVFDPHESQAGSRDRWAGLCSVAAAEDLVDPLNGPMAAANLQQSADDVADHVV